MRWRTGAKNYKRDTMTKAKEGGWWEEAGQQPGDSHWRCEADGDSALQTEEIEQ